MTAIDELFPVSSYSTAVLSPCGKYRYLLTREWDPNLPPLVVCMLNPSTADAVVNDPTIRRLIAFARREGRGGLQVVNLYALRSPDPIALYGHPDPVGPGNDRHIAEAVRGAGDVLVAWGANPGPQAARVAHVLGMIGRPVCLGTTKDGHPRHPLYVRGAEPIVAFGAVRP